MRTWWFLAVMGLRFICVWEICQVFGDKRNEHGGFVASLMLLVHFTAILRHGMDLVSATHTSPPVDEQRGDIYMHILGVLSVIAWTSQVWMVGRIGFVYCFGCALLSALGFLEPGNLRADFYVVSVFYCFSFVLLAQPTSWVCVLMIFCLFYESRWLFAAYRRAFSVQETQAPFLVTLSPW